MKQIYLLLTVVVILLLPVSSLLSLDSGPTAGYDKDSFNGFFISDTSGDFILRLGGFTQIRWNLNHREDADLSTGFDASRTRFFLEGGYTPSFSYFFQFNIDSGGQFALWNAQLQYDFNSQWNMVAGLAAFSQSREDWMSPQDTLTIEFSPNDFTFAIGTSYMVFTNHTGEKNRMWLGFSNGNYDSKNDFPKPQYRNLSWQEMIGRPGTILSAGRAGTSGFSSAWRRVTSTVLSRSIRCLWITAR